MIYVQLSVCVCICRYGWNLLCHDGLEVMECCEKHGIRVHIAGTMGGEQYSIFRPTAENKPRVDAWEALAEKHSVSCRCLLSPSVSRFYPAVSRRSLWACRHQMRLAWAHGELGGSATGPGCDVGRCESSWLDSSWACTVKGRLASKYW